jgi:hypothetical protein
MIYLLARGAGHSQHARFEQVEGQRMTVAVGRYLVDAAASEGESHGARIWLGAWSLHACPEDDGFNWRLVKRGQTTHGFPSPSAACSAAEQLGIAHARELQNDEALEASP